MEKGNISINDKTAIVISKYFEGNLKLNNEYFHKEGDGKLKITDIKINNSKVCNIKIYQDIIFEIRYQINEFPINDSEFFILISNEEGEFVTSYFEIDNNFLSSVENLTGTKQLHTKCFFSPGRYYVSAGIFNSHREFNDWVEFSESFIVEDIYLDNRIYKSRHGITIGKGEWQNV